jgi:hypothetical protein
MNNSEDSTTIVLSSGSGDSDIINSISGLDMSNYYTVNSGLTVGGITSIGTSSTTVPYTYSTGYSINGMNPTTVSIDTDGLTMAKGTDITVGGKSLTKAIEQIEERLGILHPNPELEERWDKLKDLRKQYMEMEKDILEKEKIMKILKEK